MVSKEFTIKNEMGIHMRPANLLVTAVTKHASTDVTIIFNNNRINGRSIMNIMAACIKKGSVITIECDGQHENEAMNEITELIENNFGE